MHYDVFNGDADGIIALLQLRLEYPCDSLYRTGVKRDIQLLEGLSVAEGDTVTVLDISMAKNHQPLQALLAQGASIFYADHHLPGTIPQHPRLISHIHTEATMCTALIIDHLLEHRYHQWAIAAAYGDNLSQVATEKAKRAHLTESTRSQLEQLGTLINYNSYGRSVADLHYSPAELFEQLLAYRTPEAVISDRSSPFHHLQQHYADDMAFALEQTRENHPALQVIQLPNQAVSFRISGALGNYLANQAPTKATLILTPLEDAEQNFIVSLRAPLENRQGAGQLCSQFDTGGGREGAGGVNRLAKDQVNALIRTVSDFYRSDTVYRG